MIMQPHPGRVKPRRGSLPSIPTAHLVAEPVILPFRIVPPPAGRCRLGPQTTPTRREFEQRLLTDPGIMGTARALLRYLLDERFCGAADCWPGNASIAAGMGCGERTTRRALKALSSPEGPLVIVDDHRLRSRRRLILRDHPGAAALLESLRASPHVDFARRSGRHHPVGQPSENQANSTLRQPSENQANLTPESSSRDRQTRTSNPESPQPPLAAPQAGKAGGEEISPGRSRQDEPEASRGPNPPHGAMPGPSAGEIAGPAPRPVPEPARVLATADLLLLLPGRCDLAQEAATRLVHDFGTARDGRHWGHFHEITLAAALRQIGTANLANAYGQAMRPLIERRGAKFWAAFQALESLDHPEWQEAGHG
jgi:hypothetical protein